MMIGIVLSGCSPIGIKKHPALNKIYKESWDGHPVIVEKQYFEGEYEVIIEISDEAQVKNLISHFEKANWNDSFDVDMPHPDFIFTWNSYTHYIWENERLGRLEFNIIGEGGFGNLSKRSSEKVYDIFMN